MDENIVSKVCTRATVVGIGKNIQKKDKLTKYNKLYLRSFFEKFLFFSLVVHIYK